MHYSYYKQNLNMTHTSCNCLLVVTSNVPGNIVQAAMSLTYISHIIVMVDRVERHTLSWRRIRMLAWHLARTSSIWASATSKVHLLFPMQCTKILCAIVNTSDAECVIIVGEFTRCCK